MPREIKVYTDKEEKEVPIYLELVPTAGGANVIMVDAEGYMLPGGRLIKFRLSSNQKLVFARYEKVQKEGVRTNDFGKLFEEGM